MGIFKHIYSSIKPLAIPGVLAIIGCSDIMTRTEYEAASAETKKTLREEHSTAEQRYEKALSDLRKLVTDRTTIDALIPKVAEAKEDILKQLQKDYTELTEKLRTEKEKLDSTRRLTVSDLEQQKRWFKQTAEPAIGKPEDAEGPATGVYADRKNIENHEARLANQKKAFHSLEQNLAYQRIVNEWNYKLYIEYHRKVEEHTENLQKKLDALNSAKPEEHAAAHEAFKQGAADFEKNIELLYQQQIEKRKKIPPRPDEKND